MRLSVIAAVDRNGLIGDERGLPWRLPHDLRRFRELTMGSPVLMGRTTHEHVGRPLPGRHNLVLSRRPDLALPGCTVVHSLEEALAAAGSAGEVFVIGGGEVYRETLPGAGRIYLTVVDGVFRGNAYFPVELVRPREWVVTRREVCEADEKNPHRHVFYVLDRRPAGAATGTPFDLKASLAAPGTEPEKHAGPGSGDPGPA
jgi:dihydrofolate reductase